MFALKLLYFCIVSVFVYVMYESILVNLRCFSKDSVEEIVEQLEKEDSDWARSQISVCKKCQLKKQSRHLKIV